MKILHIKLSFNKIKKVFIILVLFIITVKSYSQNNTISIESSIGYNYSLLIKPVKNYFNYNILVYMTYGNNNLSFTTGITYATKNKYSDTKISTLPYYVRIKSESLLSLIIVPVLLRKKINKSNKYNLHLQSGIEFQKHLKYTLNHYFEDGTSKTMYELKSSDKVGVALKAGLIFSKPIFKRLNVNINPYSRFIVLLDHFEPARDSYSLPYDRLSCGINFGIEYFITGK